MLRHISTINRSPHAALHYRTSYELVHSKKPDLQYFKIFDSRTYVYNETITKSSKTAPRSKIRYLIGYHGTEYYTFDPKTTKTTSTCNVKIDENTQFCHDFPDLKYNTLLDINPICSELNESFQEPEVECETPIQEIEIELDWDENPPSINLNSLIIPTMFEPVSTLGKELSLLEQVPLTLHEAMSGSNIALWKKSIKTELDSLTRHKVWTLVPRTKEMQIIPVRSLFGIKKDRTRKARLGGVGCKDKEDYSPNDTATLAPSFDTIRLLLAHVSTMKLKLVQLDIKTAFLHGDTDREKYISLPTGVAGNPKETACYLHKTLYSLRMALKCWYRTFDKYSIYMKLDLIGTFVNLVYIPKF